MKVLFVISTLRMGGAERVCALLASKFSQDHDVCLVKFDNEEPFYKLDDKVKLKCLNHGANELGMVGNFKKRVGKILELRKIIKDAKFDAIISFLDSTNLLVLGASIGLKTPVIISEHTSYMMPKAAIFDWLKRLMYPLSSALSVLTKADLNHYKKFCKNIKVIYNPFFSQKPQNLEIKKENLVLFVGRLIELKNCAMFVKIASNLSQSGYKFVVAGDGKCLQELQNLSQELGADVEFLGNVSNIGELYARAKFLLSTSKIEGLGNTLIEAIFYDCVRISTKTSGACELIKHEFDGILCEIDDVKQMSAELLQLIKDEQKCEQICKNARLRLGEFEMDKIYADWLELLAVTGVKKDVV
ncbi:MULTISPECIES: glycosyltransferase [unclassified Campylobacter]|uniref:glycosyltransferase n=1 Tax=unclassified Campylobacter TaxID=2593542 RepID=UPI003D350442